MCRSYHTDSQLSAVQSNAHREDKLSTSVCVPMLDGTLQEHCGEFPAWNKRANAIFFLAFIFMTAALFASIISVFLKCHQRLRREEYLTIGDNAISSSHPVLYRSSFHFQPPKNWMNDPNGPMYYKGFYHIFYQYNPGGAVWGNLTWGHAVSRDLLHWRDLEPALSPDQWYDYGGVWSGSVTMCPDGSPMILYTGVADDFEQSQNLAVPENISDPLLLKWVKSPENPVLRHPVGIEKVDFRDPTTAWQVHDGSWRILVGAQMGRDGMALLYKSNDLRHWELDENVLHSVPGSGMWECLDFFPVSLVGREGLDTSFSGPHIKHVLKVSFFDDKHDHYAVGTYNFSTESFLPSNPALDIQHGLHYDYGKFYASKSFYDPVKKRRIVWGWSNESDSEAQDIAKGWASLQAIPRTLWLDTALGDNLIQAPIEEVEGLRGTKASKTNVNLETGSVVKMEGSSGGQLDIEVTFEYPNVSKANIEDYGHPNEPFDCGNGGSAQRGVYGPFGLLVLTDDAFQEQTAVFFFISQDTNQRWVSHFCSDQSRSSLLPDVDTTFFWSDARVLPTENFLSVRVLVDHSIVESFVQGGRMAITSRVYPKEAMDDKAHVFLFNNGTTLIKGVVGESPGNMWKDLEVVLLTPHGRCPVGALHAHGFRNGGCGRRTSRFGFGSPSLFTDLVIVKVPLQRQSCAPMDRYNARVVQWAETPEAHLFKLRLPGLKKEDLQIQVEDDRILYITYSNQPKEEPMKEAEAAAASTSQPKEQTPGSSCSFMRKFKLPENADLEQIKAEITNETLTVTVPKRKMKSHEARKINVRDGAVAAASAAANASASTA